MSRLIAVVCITAAGLSLAACGEEASDAGATTPPADTPASAPAETPASAPANTPASPPANSMDSTPATGDIEQAADDAADTMESAVDDAAQQVSDAAETITAETRAVMEGYLAQMNDAVGALGDIESQLSAMAKAPELRSIIEQMGGFRDQLVALPDDTLTALRAEFDAQLSSLTQQLQTEINRIANDPDLAGTLGELLNQIPTSLG